MNKKVLLVDKILLIEKIWLVEWLLEKCLLLEWIILIEKILWIEKVCRNKIMVYRNYLGKQITKKIIRVLSLIPKRKLSHCIK